MSQRSFEDIQRERQRQEKSAKKKASKTPHHRHRDFDGNLSPVAPYRRGAYHGDTEEINVVMDRVHERRAARGGDNSNSPENPGFAFGDEFAASYYEGREERRQREMARRVGQMRGNDRLKILILK